MAFTKSERLKIIVWGTGYVGKMVLRDLIGHPLFELVGVIVNNPEKDGVDVGTLIGRDPIGLACSTDIDEVLSRDAVAVAHFGPTAAHPGANFKSAIASMRAGKHWVSTAMTPWVYPPVCGPGEIDSVVAICEETGKSCFTTGIDPGFANDLFPMTLMGLSGRVDSVRIQEILDYATYSGDYAPMGFGEGPEHTALLENSDILVYSWGRTIPMIADAIEVELEQIDTVWEKWFATEDIPYPFGVIKAGTVAAVRFEIRGWVNGEPRIIVEHCNRVTNDAAPDWPRATSAENDCYRVIIKGSPNITQETLFRDEFTGDANAGGCLSTGMRAVNAIPAVMAATPGMLSPLDLPLVPGVGTMRSA